jgi:hypothetical protein
MDSASSPTEGGDALALSIGNAVRGRAGIAPQVPVRAAPAPARGWSRPRMAIYAIVMWMIRGYQHANAGDLAAAVAFNAMAALIRRSC